MLVQIIKISCATVFLPENQTPNVDAISRLQISIIDILKKSAKICGLELDGVYTAARNEEAGSHFGPLGQGGTTDLGPCPAGTQQ
jgi:hypothetical protein